MSKPRDETKRKISESVKKRWRDKEYRNKVSNAHKHKLPDEWFCILDYIEKGGGYIG